MATYSIRTSRTQEVGLKFVYDHLPDPTLFPTQESYLQFQVNILVTDPMYVQYQQAQSTSFDQSFNTIPEAEQPKAKTEIEATIVANGGTIVPAVPPVPPAVVIPVPPVLPDPPPPPEVV